LGPDGKPEATTQWGVSTYRYSSDGKNLAILNSNTLSTAEVNKNGFATTMQSQGGAVVNEDAVKGQSVADNHVYKLNKRVEADVTIGSSWFYGRDLTSITPNERKVLIGLASADYTMQKASQGVSVYRGVKGLKGSGGKVPTEAGPTSMDSTSWKEYFDRLNKTARPGSATPAPPATSPVTIRPLP
jgi:hypothetical protein